VLAAVIRSAGAGIIDGVLAEVFTLIGPLVRLPVGTLLGVTDETEGALLGVTDATDGDTAWFGVAAEVTGEVTPEVTPEVTAGPGTGEATGQELAVYPPTGFCTQVPDGRMALWQPVWQIASAQTPPVNEPSGLHAPVAYMPPPRGAQKGLGRYWVCEVPLQEESVGPKTLTVT